MTKTQVKGNDTLLWININGFYVNNYFKYFTFSSTFYRIFKSKVKFRFVYCLCSWQYSVLTCLKPPKHYFELILYMYMFPECFNFDMRKVISLEITYLTIYFCEYQHRFEILMDSIKWLSNVCVLNKKLIVLSKDNL